MLCLRWLGALPPTPIASGGRGIRPQTPATSPPPIANFWLRACLKKNLLHVTAGQSWSRGHKARGQGQGHKKNPRPRSRTAFPRADTLEAKDRNARGQGQGPRTQSASALQKKKKKRLHKNFSGDLKKKKIFFQAISTK